MAAPIAQRFIEDLLARTDIAEIIGERIALKKTGQNLSGLCPFHQEKSPSFTVSQKKQFYHCFGCGAHGNALQFLMAFDHCTFPQSVEILASRLGVEIEYQPTQVGSTPETHSPKIAYQVGYDLLNQATIWFQEELKSSSAQVAQRYLTKRQISVEMQQRFAVGYAPHQWQALHHHLKSKGFSESLQSEYGVLSFHEQKQSYYDRFRHRIIFPIYDWKGRVIAFGGRLLGEGKPKYLNSSETPLFHKGRELFGLYQARQSNHTLDSLLIVEGYVDVITLFQYGFTASVATLGTALTTDHLQRLFNLVDQLIFCFDGDQAGKQAAQRALSVVLPLMSGKRQVRFLFLPDNEDPDSYLKTHGAKSFNALLTCASPLSEFIFMLAKPTISPNQVETREQFIQQAMQYILLLPEGLLRTLLLQELATRAKFSLHDLERFAEKQVNKTRIENTVIPSSSTSVLSQAKPSAVSRTSNSGVANIRNVTTQSLTRRVLHLLMHTPTLVNYLPQQQYWCPTTREGQLLINVINLLRAGQYQSPQVVLAHFLGSAEGQLLQQLAQQEMVIPVDNRIIEMQALVAALTHERQLFSPEDEYRQLVARSQQGQLLTEQDKNRLRELITLLQAHKP